MLLALDDGVDVGRGVLVVERLFDLPLLHDRKVPGGELQPILIHVLPPSFKLPRGKGLVGDELEPEDALLLGVLEPEAGVGARLADVVDFGRLHDVDDLAAAVDLAAMVVLGGISIGFSIIYSSFWFFRP